MLIDYLLRRADDALILGHRLSEWTGHAPMMEEDMALANMALDLIGQARSLYAYAAEIGGGSEDSLAYLRREGAYKNLLLVEQPNGDFAMTILRQFFYSAFADPFWRASMPSTDATLAAVAAKAEKEMAYHLRHSAEWVVRLGDSTPEARRRIEAAITKLWPYTGEMFEADEAGLVESKIAVDPALLAADWRDTVAQVFARATLSVPRDGWMQTGGRHGRHSEHLGHILSELQYMQRTFPGATW